MPLEKNVVRFLDNFSAGTRGAASAEYFLEAGYAVIFMSRQHSQFPFTRWYSHTTNPLFDLLKEPAEGEDTVSVSQDHVQGLLPILRAYHQATRRGRLLTVPFVTVTEYLFLLRNVSQAMAPLGHRGMHYLAAAVSDFFVPADKLSEHKIQSSDQSLTLRLEPVPKVLGTLVDSWAPDAYVVSFKLETDGDLLIPKAESSLRKYGHQLVIGNLLQRRKYEIVLVEPHDHTWIRLPTPPAVPPHEIERDIVAAIAERHQAWIASV